MKGKIIVVIFAFVAGAAGAYAYELIGGEIISFPAKEDPGIARLEEQLVNANNRISELEHLQIESQTGNEVLIARLNSLSEQLAKFQEKQGENSISKSEITSNNPIVQGDNDSQFRPNDETAPVQMQRISGEQLVEALKEMPEEGRQMIRQAIHKEVMRIRQEQKETLPPRKELEKKVEQVIMKITPALSLTPVQVEQAREIGARHIEAMLEAEQVAKERNDPEYARSARKQVENDTKRQIVEILTPEQLDKLREMDPEGIGKEYPRGF